MNPTGVLRELGLDEKEIAVYLGLLELGEASILEISRKTGVKRPTAYLIVESLEKKGLVSRVTKGKKISFIPQHPRKIETETQLRLSQLKEVMPQFEAMMKRSDLRPRVMIYEGKEALDRAYDDAFLSKGEMLFMSNIDVTQDVYARTLQKMEYVTLSSDYSMRELMVESEASKKYAARVAGPYRKGRFMPKEFSPFATDIGIFGMNTVITSGTKEYFCVRIESAEISDAFRALFEAMWLVSKDTDNESE